MKDYSAFLKLKEHSIGNHGIEPAFIPDRMFDFQKYITEYQIRKGRCAGFLDTGTGKTLMEIVIAVNYSSFTH